MPNWVEQDLHVVGAKADVDRFIRTGLIRRKPGEIDDVLDFERLCPLKSGTEDRPWRVMARAPWKHKSMPFDAHFDDDFFFYFRTRDELAGFRERFKSIGVMRFAEGSWRPARSK